MFINRAYQLMQVGLFPSVPMRDVLEGIESLIPSFRGVKFSDPNLADLGLCISYSPAQWAFLYGVDEVSVSLNLLWSSR